MTVSNLAVKKKSSVGILVLYTVIAVTFAGVALFSTNSSVSNRVIAASSGNQSGSFAVNSTATDLGFSFSSPDDGASVTVGESVTLNWSTDDATDLVASGASEWNTQKPVDNNNAQSESITINSPGSKTLTLQASHSGNGNSETQSVSFNVDPEDPVISNFSVNDQDAPSDDTVYPNNTFGLVWSTQNTGGNVSASSGNSNWSGPVAVSRGMPGKPISESAPGSYDYTLTAYDTQGNNPVSLTRTVEVVPRPATYDLSAAPAAVDIEGVPGSSANTSVEISDTQNFSGTVDLSVTGIPERDGNDLFTVSIADDSLSTPDGATDVTIETSQVIRSDQTYTIRIEGSDTPDNNSDFIDITINADGFSPRTIEEF